MSGELRTSQFRWTTTANSDFVIGSPEDVGALGPRYLVFQTTTTPGYATNPHMVCDHTSGSWELKISPTGGVGGGDYFSLTDAAYKSQTNTFTGINTFDTGAFTVNSLVYLYGATTTIGDTSGDTLTVNSTTTFNNDVTVSGTLNVAGAINHTTTTNLDVTDKTITLNNGGGAASGGTSGIEVEESAAVAGYIRTSAARTGWDLKAPATAGIATLVTPASSVTLTLPTSTGTLALTSDIHAAVTLGTANGLSLSTQALSLGLSSTSTTGALSNTDWNTFNSRAVDNTVVHLTGAEVITGDKTFWGLFSHTGTSAFPVVQYVNKYGYSDWFYRSGIGDPGSGGTGYIMLTAEHDDSYIGNMTIKSYYDDVLGTSIVLGSSVLSCRVFGENGSRLAYAANKTTLSLLGGTAGSSLILKDRTTGVQYEIYVNSGVLTLAAV